MGNQPYRTLFIGVLEQESALSIGGNEGGGVANLPLCRDGEGRLTLRGDGLAGALIATARKLYGDDTEKISEEITGDRDDKEHKKPSRWMFSHSHPQSNLSGEERQGVGIRQDTGASADTALFDIETVPRGMCWDFCLEVDTCDAEGENAEHIAAAALMEWTRGRCWLGRSVARGMGWMRLKNLRAYRLNCEHLDLWPDSFRDPQVVLKDLQKEIPIVEACDFESIFNISPSLPNERWQYRNIEGTIKVGANPTGYGWDAISLGKPQSAFDINEWKENLVSAPSRKKDMSFSLNMSIMLTRKGKTLEPYIPGSSLRGPLRHALSRYWRSQGIDIWDPNAHESEIEDDRVRDLFGSMTQGARLLVRDAYLQGDWKATLLQHHAEDEFSAGAYESSKFDRTCLLKGTFAWKMTIEIPPGKKIEKIEESMNYLKKLGEIGHLPLGGCQWRGMGWATWEITSEKTCKSGEE